MPSDSDIAKRACYRIGAQRGSIFRGARLKSDADRAVPILRELGADADEVNRRIRRRIIVFSRIDFDFFFFHTQKVTIGIVYIFSYFDLLALLHADRNIVRLSVSNGIRGVNRVHREKRAPQKNRQHGCREHTAFDPARSAFRMRVRQLRGDHPAIFHLAPNQLINLVHLLPPQMSNCSQSKTLQFTHNFLYRIYYISYVYL